MLPAMPPEHAFHCRIFGLVETSYYDRTRNVSVMMVLQAGTVNEDLPGECTIALDVESALALNTVFDWGCSQVPT